ncbi:HNH endonuclease [Bradyrhizobium japonicum]|uniref:HNH endonuclease n=1 Tax=Bradyrhizobium japonicum TaxID=375 RepID=UPI0004A45094|nr:HNH endonuclease [Bradyrhizobium japonicum]
MANTLPSPDYLRECFSYDGMTGTLVWKNRPLHHFVRDKHRRCFNTKWAGKSAGNISVQGYLVVKLNGKLFFGHRIIWKMVRGTEPEQIDHKNLTRSDNRIDNLRACSLPQNGMNRSIYRNNKTGLKGVSCRDGRFRATIQVNRKAKTIGSFDTAEEAHEAYRAAADRLHGSFASYG